ncbi:MAG: hypothetical protein JKY02_00200 [Flavobacteriaceae bacterium]|nr:hypothetical protein [Flavobacteriaceae bacterium]
MVSEVKLDNIKESIKYFTEIDINKISSYESQSEEAMLHMDNIDSSGFHLIDSKVVTKLKDSPRVQKSLIEFSKRYHLLGIHIELYQARQIISSNDPKREYAKIPLKGYLATTSAEVNGANLKKGDKVIFIGSGPMPITLIQLYEHFGIESIGIEIIPEIAEVSRKLIESLGYSDKIKIITGDHHSITSAKEINHINVAYAAHPINEILVHLKSIISTNTTISYRFDAINQHEGTIRGIIDNRKTEVKEFNGLETFHLCVPEKKANSCIKFLRLQNGRSDKK